MMTRYFVTARAQQNLSHASHHQKMSVLRYSMDEERDASAEDGISTEEDAFARLFTLPEEPSTKRPVCQRCKRPSRESRSLATVPLLRQCLPPDRISVIRGKRFGPEKSEILNKALRSRNTILLFPGKDANDISNLPRQPIGLHDDAALIAIDGTWSQSKGLYYHNPRLHDAPQVQLNVDGKSAYVIRTQPTKSSLSTLECIAHALAWLENSDEVAEVLVRPLQALCDHQLQHGAVEHHSKDNPEYIPRAEMKLRMKEKAKGVNSENGVPA